MPRLAWIFLATATTLNAAQLAWGAESVSFTQTIKPLLARHCYACHGPEASEGGLRLDDPTRATAELDSGSLAIVPGDPSASMLLERVRSADESVRMPPEGEPLTAEQIADLEQWIAEGALWNQHWAFVPPVRRDPPLVADEFWSRHPIDAFLFDSMAAHGLRPAPPADRRTIARRAYYNLTGLPPTEGQLAAFLADERPDAYERLVDQLLASPHYGERWARHWLDVVRYGESNSFERDNPKPNVWKYRDYVIRSFNEDKPYDQFVIEQLAGDELADPSRDAIIATGYYRLGIWDDEPADPVQALADEMDDLIATTSQAMLGLTINCARCHDHKIDPIPQRNYYGLAAFFADVTTYGTRPDQTSNNQWELGDPADLAARQELTEQRTALEQQKMALEQSAIVRMSATDQRRSETPERKKLLKEKLGDYFTPDEAVQYEAQQAQLAEVRERLKQIPSGEQVLALAKTRMPPPVTHIALRGNPHVPGEPVEPHFPDLFDAAAVELPTPMAGARSSGRRMALAHWIASPENYLTARVIVNRVWQHHFGRGVVRSPNNFGELGVPPTHPELLDWLACWFIDQQWRLKPLHRLIASSMAYQMSSQPSEEARTKDPENDWFSHFNMRRLDAEEIRDAALATTGELNLELFGPSIYPKLSEEVLATQSMPGNNWGNSSPTERARRSIYVHVKRSLADPLLAAFDFPDSDIPCAARFQTTQPAQALALVNGAFFNHRAGALAARVTDDLPEASVADQLAEALSTTLGRKANQQEMAAAQALYRQLREEHACSAEEALRWWCLTVLNLNEFIYLD